MENIRLKVTIIWLNTKYSVFHDVVYYDMYCKNGKDYLSISIYGEAETKIFDLKNVYRFRVEIDQ